MSITQHWLNNEHDDDAEAELRDSFTTPLPLAHDVGEFDYDVASNSRSLIRARKHFMLERGQDGLKLAKYVPRSARVWCNPPYSRGLVMQFLLAYQHTRFVFLLRDDSSTLWWKHLLTLVEVIARPVKCERLPTGRINFDPPPELPLIAHNNPYPHTLFYRDASMVTPAIRETCVLLRPER